MRNKRVLKFDIVSGFYGTRNSLLSFQSRAPLLFVSLTYLNVVSTILLQGSNQIVKLVQHGTSLVEIVTERVKNMYLAHNMGKHLCF